MRTKLIVIFLIAFVLHGCAGGGTEKAATAIVVQAVSAKALDLDEILELSGIVNAKPNLSVKLSPAVQGLLSSVGPRAGDFVHKGQVIATLQDSIQSAQLEQANASLDLAQANLDRANNGARLQEVEQAKAALEVAKANWENAHNARLRLEKLLKDDVVAGRDYDLAVSQEKVASAQQASAAANLALVKKGLRLEDRRAVRAQAAQATANVHQANANFALTRIVSPISGVVAERYLNVGDQTGPSTPVMLVVDTSTVFVQANFPVGYNQLLEANDRVEIVPPGTGATIEGKVLSVGVKVDPVTNTIPTQVEVRNERSILKLGMVVRCRVMLSVHRNAVAIPKSCLIASPDNPTKFVVNMVENGRSSAVNVVTGITSGDNVEVISGLKPGQLVIKDVGYELPKGTPVQIK